MNDRVYRASVLYVNILDTLLSAPAIVGGRAVAHAKCIRIAPTKETAGISPESAVIRAPLTISP